MQNNICLLHFLISHSKNNYYPEYQRLSFQINLWRPSVEILSRMCQSNSYKKNQRWRANFTILMSSRLYQYTCLLLMNSLEASKCNWNDFCSKEIFYTIPKCISNYLTINYNNVTSIWNRNNIKTFMLWFSITDSFVDFCESI